MKFRQKVSAFLPQVPSCDSPVGSTSKFYQRSGNTDLAALGLILGFTVMMILDVTFNFDCCL